MVESELHSLAITVFELCTAVTYLEVYDEKPYTDWDLVYGQKDEPGVVRRRDGSKASRPRRDYLWKDFF